jgi:hypothetical protein
MKTKHNIAIFIFILFVALYLLTASGYSIYSSDVGLARLETLKSIVERFDLSIPPGMGITGKDGREYSPFAIGSVLIAIPFYLVQKIIGLSNLVPMINQLAGATTVVLVFRFCSFLANSRRASIYTAFFYGLGSMAFYYAKDPGDHALETLFILLCMYWMYRYHKSKKASTLLLSGASFGLAFVTRYTSMLALPSLLILLLYHDYANFRESNLAEIVKKLVIKCGIFGIAALPFVGIASWYNYQRFGSVFETGYSLMATRLGLSFFGGIPILTGLAGFLVSPGKGFFYYSPAALLFFFALKTFYKKHPALALSFVSLILCYLLFYASYLFWHGDWAWGPRYIFVLTPFFIIPIATLLDMEPCRTKISRKSGVAILFAVSVAIQILAVSSHPFRYFLSFLLEQNVTFTVVRGNGVKPIVVPPAEVYFDWHKSPILAQGRYFLENIRALGTYRYSAPQSTTPSPKDLSVPPSINATDLRRHPLMNLFDFWWCYDYYITYTYSGLFSAAILFSLVIYCAVRLRQLSVASGSYP